MSLEDVRQVSAEHPELVRTNLGSTCYQHTVFLIAKLRAAGHTAQHICKTAGEGQYTPPGFVPRIVAGLDGKPYTITGVSHDAIYCDGRQVDTLAQANDSETPIGLVAIPVWNEIAREYWRNNNPPLPNDGTPVPVPTPTPPPPSAPVYPSYEALGGDAGGIKITRMLEADYKRAGARGLDGDCGAWQQRVSYDFLTGICKTVEEAIAKHRRSWCQTLGIDVE